MSERTKPTEIKSVSSTSNQDEEFTLSSDSSVDLRVPRREEDKKQKTPETKHKLLVEDLVEPAVARSPAPVPIRGGDDEVIQVSQIRKIKVNSMVADPKKKLDLEPRYHTKTSKSSSLTRETTGFKKKVNMDDASETSEVASDCEPMEKIEKSPYELHQNAEYALEMFTKLRSILQEQINNDDYRTVNREASKIFGPTNAWCLVKASALIDKSGMVFSQEWVNGNIRGNQLGKLPKELLLLCLVSKRFARAQDLLLSGLTRDLEVCSMIQEALNTWKIKNGYSRIRAITKNFQFTTKRRACYKCAIFVARVYCCLKAFSAESTLDPQVQEMVMTCLDMMEEHLPQSSSTKRSRKSIETTTAEVAPAKVLSDPAAPPKRKRGRPRKHPLPPPKPDPDPDTLSQDSLFDDEADMVPYNPPVRTKKRKTSTAKKPPASPLTPSGKASLTTLLARFESQYEAMGVVYREMGDTLKEIRTKVEDNRTATEEEIRNELLEEVQESLLRSFGKKL